MNNRAKIKRTVHAFLFHWRENWKALLPYFGVFININHKMFTKIIFFFWILWGFLTLHRLLGLVQLRWQQFIAINTTKILTFIYQYWWFRAFRGLKYFQVFRLFKRTQAFLRLLDFRRFRGCIGSKAFQYFRVFRGLQGSRGFHHTN